MFPYDPTMQLNSLLIFLIRFDTSLSYACSYNAVLGSNAITENTHLFTRRLSEIVQRMAVNFRKWNLRRCDV